MKNKRLREGREIMFFAIKLFRAAVMILFTVFIGMIMWFPFTLIASPIIWFFNNSSYKEIQEEYIGIWDDMISDFLRNLRGTKNEKEK
jgi:hypothetical protein